jgi:hypothetical protein
MFLCTAIRRAAPTVTTMTAAALPIGNTTATRHLFSEWKAAMADEYTVTASKASKAEQQKAPTAPVSAEWRSVISDDEGRTAIPSLRRQYVSTAAFTDVMSS